MGKIMRNLVLNFCGAVVLAGAFLVLLLAYFDVLIK